MTSNSKSPRSSFATLLAVSAMLLLTTACTVEPVAERKAQLESELFAKTTVLWPVAKGTGTATVRVCWMKPRLTTAYPVANLAPNVAAILSERKAWVREIAEAEWNAKTPLRFIGWKDCTKNDLLKGAVRLTPIDSATPVPCGANGQSCAEALGRQMAGKMVYLNLFFGEEVRYSSRYQQRNPGASYDEKLDMQRSLVPSFCIEEFSFAWAESNTKTSFPVDVDQAEHRAKFDAIYRSCLKGNALHELGHVAGLAHEQYRTDDLAAQKRCRAIEEARGIGDDFVNIDPKYRGDTPMGPFDAESIMSYCRLDKDPTLTTLDVLTMRALYIGKPLPKNAPPPANEDDGVDGVDGKDGEDGEAF